jgi:hypothetical protein
MMGPPPTAAEDLATRLLLPVYNFVRVLERSEGALQRPEVCWRIVAGNAVLIVLIIAVWALAFVLVLTQPVQLRTMDPPPNTPITIAAIPPDSPATRPAPRGSTAPTPVPHRSPPPSGKEPATHQRTDASPPRVRSSGARVAALRLGAQVATGITADVDTGATTGSLTLKADTQVSLGALLTAGQGTRCEYVINGATHVVDDGRQELIHLTGQRFDVTLTADHGDLSSCLMADPAGRSDPVAPEEPSAAASPATTPGRCALDLRSLPLLGSTCQ